MTTNGKIGDIMNTHCHRVYIRLLKPHVFAVGRHMVYLCAIVKYSILEHISRLKIPTVGSSTPRHSDCRKPLLRFAHQDWIQV
ncbi:Hypothetical protein SMAX5B_022518 [Scophthalmus maximus]|uniref:Uncharacterized protein n=1 Tax=Scophthalmus maximus TaxID=52904 RepID=A0A2U9C7G5_SCOMX|nr:Hypothetical protein SMAX5B_022518 [Scophthalmus maximus]KAF0042113.1 hypothetical protein F2P81_005645 [Scophthalmus maximus]